MDKNDFREKALDYLCDIEDNTESTNSLLETIRDAEDDQRNTIENIDDSINDINRHILKYNKLIDEIKLIQRGFAIAAFVISFIVSFGIGLMINSKKFKKAIKKLR